MTVLGILTGLLVPVAASAALLRAAVPSLWIGSRTLVLSLAVLVALGFSSLLFTASIFAFGPRWPLYVPLEISVWIAVLVVSLRALPRHLEAAPATPRFTRIELLAAMLFAGTVAVSGLYFYWTTVNSPSGTWDAQAIWNLRARFLDRGFEGHWRDAFQAALAWSHPNYPLMLPSSVARLWLHMGAESSVSPILLAMLFECSTVGTLVGALTAAGRRWEGFLAGAILLASLTFNLVGVGQISDVPLGAFVLAATVLLSWILDQLPEQSPRAASALLAFCAGCAAWTKNEGLVFALAICTVLAGVILLRRRDAIRLLVYTLAGLSIPLAALMYFKRNLAPPSYLLESLSLSNPPQQVWDLERHTYILRSFARELWAWNTSLPIGIIPFVTAYAVGTMAVRGLRHAQLVTAVPLVAMLAGYYGAYVVTPLDLKWHIASSLSRLLVQIWPAAVFVCFAIAAPLTASDANTQRSRPSVVSS